MNSCNMWISFEIIYIQRQKMGYAVNLRNSGQPGVVDLRPRNRMGDHKLSPFTVRGLVIRQEHHSLLNCRNFPINVRRREAKTIPVSRPCGDIPKFSYVLLGVIKSRSVES